MYRDVTCLCVLVEDASKRHPFPCPTTYRTALTHYISLTHTPGTNVLKELSEYAEDEKDKEFLTKCVASTPEGKVCMCTDLFSSLREIYSYVALSVTSETMFGLLFCVHVHVY